MKREVICGIYMITSPSGCIYIGQSLDIYSRWSRYRSFRCEEQIRLYNSLKKYGIESHKFEILCECMEAELEYLETGFIKFFDTFDTPYGLNLRIGGKHGKMSQETRNKISKIHKGRKFSEEHKMKIGEAHKGEKSPFYGIPKTQEFKENMSNRLKGVRFTDEHKDKISKAHIGKKHSEIHIENNRLAQIGKKLTEEHRLINAG